MPNNYPHEDDRSPTLYSSYTARPGPGTSWESSFVDDRGPPSLFFNGGPRYQTLGRSCQWVDTYDGMTEYGTSAATTDRRRWACPSLPTIPKRSSSSFFRYLDTPLKLNEMPSYYLSTDDIETTAPKPPVPPSSSPAPLLPSKSIEFSGHFDIAPVQKPGGDRQGEIEEERRTQENFTVTTPPLLSSSSSSSGALPITHYEYNIREMMKNCILLEDHLIHPEKRCNDCCVKHFLFLEGLAEEARTLDRAQSMPESLHSAPRFFRDCQQSYYQIGRTPMPPPDAERHYQKLAQRLRQFRKQHQQAYFPILWGASASSASSASSAPYCTSGVCPNTPAPA